MKDWKDQLFEKTKDKPLTGIFAEDAKKNNYEGP